jgi:hypothetical protein
VAKKAQRRLEQRWKSTRLEALWVTYPAACRVANRLINEASKMHCANAVAELSRDPHALWRVVKGLLQTSKSATAPQPGLCDSFSTFFTNKVQKAGL